ncbi:MAG: AAA family ATPase, partial [Candidatus Daviesbacteria bacterium]|nr:AAA family ATPase [Candidatus Daviesbacteria bacterium]
MFLKQLNLINFRNYSALNLQFDSRPTIFVGNNAVGKSNLLEAIYFLSTTKSGRVNEEMELIKQGENVSRIEGEIEETKLQITMEDRDNFSKKVKVNGVPKRVVDYIGNMPVVLFS